MRKKNKTQIKIDYILQEFEETNDAKLLIKLYELYKSGDLKFTVLISNTELTFYEKSKCDSKCCKCSDKIIKDVSAIFYQNKKAWHANCGSTEDKLNNYYLGWIKKQNNNNIIVPTINDVVVDTNNIFNDKFLFGEED